MEVRMEKEEIPTKGVLIERIIKLWLPVIVWSLFIFSFSSNPTARASEVHWQDFLIKKSAHIFEYAIFSVLLYRALKESGVAKKEAAIYALILAVLYGASDEFHQSFTPGREPTVRDVVFDTIGASIGVYFIWKLLPKVPKKLKDLAGKLQLT